MKVMSYFSVISDKLRRNFYRRNKAIKLLLFENRNVEENNEEEFR